MTLNGWEKVGSEESKWEVDRWCFDWYWDTFNACLHQRAVQNIFAIEQRSVLMMVATQDSIFERHETPLLKDGYEAQIDSTHKDPIRTGSLYGFLNIYRDLVQPNEWFTYELEVRDDQWRRRDLTRIRVIVNGDELYEYLDFSKTFTEGYFAFQQHDPGSVVNIRKVEVMPLPD